jgi:TRAP-type uncharacterized transport system substrate-binding protein
MAPPDHSRSLAQQGLSQPWYGRTFLLRLLLSVGVVLGLGLTALHLDVRHDMRRLRISLLSGSVSGNYHRVVAQLSELAKKEKGVVQNLVSEGSGDNVARLAAAAQNCEVGAALAQDGALFGKPEPRLLGRLPRAESVFFLGKNADRISDFSQLAGMRIGVGPEGSGGTLVAKQLFALPELRRLGVTLSRHALADQLALAARGELDLALVVIDEDAALVSQAVLQQGLELVGFRHADVIARRLPHLRTGRIGAGQYDAVALLPNADKKVLRVETLVLSNGCASRSETMDLLTLLARQFPDFARHNRDTPNTTGLTLDPAAQDFFARGSPELADEYLPWLVDVMPPANWVYVVMGVSLLFNAMDFGHRFRLWRIDAARVALESKLAKAFGGAATVADLARATPEPEQAAFVQAVAAELEELAARSRRQSLSLLVPMGAEMTYRYQEELMQQISSALREYQRRVEEGARGKSA